MSTLELRLTHLYPQEMNLYGDLGNVICLQKRAQWRGINLKVHNAGLGVDLPATQTDIYFFGGGQDADQLRVFGDLAGAKAETLRSDIEADVCFLAICGGYQLLGEYFLDSQGNNIEGLKVLPIATRAPSAEMKQRAVGNLLTDISAHKDICSHPSGLQTLLGFENHSGRTEFLSHDNIQPLGRVLVGIGDNWDRQHEGARYRNVVGSYMHGSLLPKNPHLADWLLKTALTRKYGIEEVTKVWRSLDDSAEIAAHNLLRSRLQ